MLDSLSRKNATTDTALILYAEISPAQKRAAQRGVQAGQLSRIAPGIVSSLPPSDWPALMARERLRVLAALFPGAVLSHRSAFNGGQAEDGVIHLTHNSKRTAKLPGLTVMLWKGPPPAPGDTVMLGRELYFPSLPRLPALSCGNFYQSTQGSQRTEAGP